jgi:hypothetical protein
MTGAFVEGLVESGTAQYAVLSDCATEEAPNNKTAQK